ncbi:MAG: hypothetical protein ACFFD1_08105 [Candidatus Thorarchaeota archaeon]
MDITQDYCNRCMDQDSEFPSQETESVHNDPEFIQKKLKPILRSGRETKPIKSIARQLNISETDLHETFKQLDSENGLPYGYYDKIERLFVRTHQEEEIDENLLLDMIKQSYGFKTFHHQGLTGYLRAGRHVPSRKVLSALHQLRKKQKILGFKKGQRWLWRLPNPDEKEGKVDKVRYTTTHKNESGHKIKNSDFTSSGGFQFASEELSFSGTSIDNKSHSKIDDDIEGEDSEKDNNEEENYSLAELARSVGHNSTVQQVSYDDDDDDDFNIEFEDPEEED